MIIVIVALLASNSAADLFREQSLELLDCQALQLTGWKREPGSVSMRKVYLNGCDYMTNQAARSLIEMCGHGLKKFILTGKTFVCNALNWQLRFDFAGMPFVQEL